VIDDVAEVVFPAASRAVNVRVVFPSGKVDGASEAMVGFESTRSTARAARRKAEIEASVRGTGLEATRLIGLGTVRRGGVVSTTLTVNEPEALTP
jgi:hypothetical protein